jgi:hypothetical protein
MTRYELVPATPLHVGPLVSRLGYQADQVHSLGGKPRQWLRCLMDQSCECWAVLIEGRPVAMWGLVGNRLATEARVWLSIADEVRVLKFPLVRECRRQVMRALEGRAALVGTVIAGDQRAIRFARCLGFEVDQDTVVWGDFPAHPIRLTR